MATELDFVLNADASFANALRRTDFPVPVMPVMAIDVPGSGIKESILKRVLL